MSARLRIPEGVGSAASVSCGAVLRVSLRVDEAQRITGAKFKVAGCSYLVAVCSVLSTVMTGKTTGEAAVICQPANAVLSLLGEGWPAEKRRLPGACQPRICCRNQQLQRRRAGRMVGI